MVKGHFSIFYKGLFFVKPVIYILQNALTQTPSSSENKGQLAGNLVQFPALYGSSFVRFLAFRLHFAPFCLSIWSPTRIFFNSKYPLLAPKTLLFNGYYAPFCYVFHGHKRFCLYKCCGCLCFSPCILHHFTLRLAPKRTPFSTKMH
ncbi:MAG: hypothetical protein ACFNVK_09780, partial [Prevotella sp.]